MRSLKNKAQALLARAGVAIGGTAPHDVVVHDESVFSDVFIRGSLGLGDAYERGKWDVPQLDVFFDRVLRCGLERHIGKFSDYVQRIRDWVLNTQSVRRAFQVGERHYDLGNRLYELMLGESMGYSSGYYGNGATTLTEAQYAKFDLLCKKINLKPGMRILEIGCGWGTFAEHAIRTYGVTLVGLSVSKEQLTYARARCAGLPAEFLLMDYRALPETYNGTFDRVVSIEMIEAVGVKNFRSYFSVATRALKPNGMFGLQVIVGSGLPDVWISTRIFPNGVLPSLLQLSAAIRNLLRIHTYESFGQDYARTLRAWDERFVAAWDQIKHLKSDSGEVLYDERFFRRWRYYLNICAGAFSSGKIHVAQVVLVKDGASAL